MTHQFDDGVSRQTRRQILRATAISTVSVAGLASAGAAAEEPEYSEEVQAVLDEYGDPDQMLAALEQQEDVKETLRENDLVEGEDRFVYLYARQYNEGDEPEPEYNIVRDTPDGGHVNAALLPEQGTGHVVDGQPGDDFGDIICVSTNTHQDCLNSCEDDECHSCTGPAKQCGCDCAHLPCDPYCCYKCICDDSNADDCECEDCPPVIDIELDPLDEDWFVDAVLEETG